MTHSQRDKIIIVAAAALIAAMWWWDAVLSRPEFDHIGAMSDLVNLQLYVQKMENPQLFPTDYLFSSADGARQYTASYRWTLSALSRITSDFGNALVLLVPMLAFVYVITMTLFLRRFTSSLLLAILLAAVSSVPHYAPGNEFWGTGGLYSALPRSVFASVAPLLLLAHLRFASSLRGSSLSLGLAGLAANLHPPSGAGLAQVLLAERAMAALRRRFPWKGVLLSAACFVLFASPFILGFFSIAGKSHAATASPDPAAFYAAVSLRFPQMLLPLSREVLWSFAEAFLPLLPFVFLGALSLRARPAQKEEIAGALRLSGVLILVVIGGQIALQVLARSIGWSFMLIDQLRGLRMIYPLAFALAAAGLEAIRIRVPRWLFAPATLASAMLLLPVISLPSFRLTRMYFPRPAALAYHLLIGETDKFRQEYQSPLVKPRTLAMEEVSKWASNNSSPQSLFLCDDGRFRLFSRRSVAFAFKDGGTCYYLGKGMFMEWARREAAVRKARDSRKLEEWMALAKELGCDFAVVDKTMMDSPFIAAAAYQNDIFAVVPTETGAR